MRSTLLLVALGATALLLATLDRVQAQSASALASRLSGVLSDTLTNVVKFPQLESHFATPSTWEAAGGSTVNARDRTDAVARAITALIASKEAALRKNVDKFEDEWKDVYNLEGTEGTECTTYVDRDGDLPPNLANHTPQYGPLMDLAHSSVTWVEDLDKTDDVRRVLCASATLDKVFTSNFNSDSSLKFQHFGAAAGFWRAFPGHACQPGANGKCGAYDPRVRPWYVSAATGSKSVVLVLDTSGSMSKEGRLGLMQAAAKAVLTTLTQHDFFNIVGFSSDARTPQLGTVCLGTGMVRATSFNKSAGIAAIDALTASGETNYEAGFKKAFEVIEQGRKDDAASKCRTAILFLTDGQRTAGDDPVPVVKDLNGDDIDAHVFTYALGADVGKSEGELKDIACQNKGAFARVEDGGDLVTKMASYFQIIAAGIERDEVVWTTPYKDATGLVSGDGGLLVTGSLVVYDRENFKDFSVPLGVFGIDIMMSEFSDLLLTLETEDSYAFLIDRAGATYAHPRLGTSANVQVAGIDDLFMDISLIETMNVVDRDQFNQIVRPGLIGGGRGSATLNIERIRLRGGAEAGIEVLPSTGTNYYWAAAGPFFSVCFAQKQGDDVVYRMADTATTSDSWFYKLGLYPSSVLSAGGVEKVFASHLGQEVSYNTTTYFLPARAFENPYKFSETKEDAGFVAKIHAYMNADGTGAPNNMVLGGTGAADGVRGSVKYDADSVFPLWGGAEERLPALKYNCWSILSSGMISCYPGVTDIDRTYDPVTRPFFRRALAFEGKFSLSSPYLDAWVDQQSGAALSDQVVVSTFKTIKPMSHDGAFAIAGFDVTYEGLLGVMDSVCNVSECVLVDASGFLISAPNFRAFSERGHWAFTNHLRDGPFWAKAIWTALLSMPGVLDTKQFTDYGNKRECTSFTITSQMQESISVTSSCLLTNGATITMAAVPDTNTYLIAVDTWNNCDLSINAWVPSEASSFCTSLEFSSCSPPPEFSRDDEPECSDFSATEEQLDVIRDNNGDARCGLWWWEWLLIAIFAIWLPVFGCAAMVANWSFRSEYKASHDENNPTCPMYLGVCVGVMIPLLGWAILGAVLFYHFQKHKNYETEMKTHGDGTNRKQKVSTSQGTERKTSPEERRERARKAKRARARESHREREAERKARKLEEQSSSSSETSAMSKSTTSEQSSESSSEMTSSTSSSVETTSTTGGDAIENCLVCQRRPPSTLLAPCGDGGFCSSCAQGLKGSNCPVCNGGVTGIIKPF